MHIIFPLKPFKMKLFCGTYKYFRSFSLRRKPGFKIHYSYRNFNYMNIRQYSDFCNLLNLGYFSRSIDDSVSTIGDLNFKIITMHMIVVSGNEVSSCRQVSAARKRCIWKIGMKLLNACQFSGCSFFWCSVNFREN